MSDEKEVTTATTETTTSTDVATATTEASKSTTEVGNIPLKTDWFNSLDESLRNEPSLASFKDKEVSEVVKSYINAQKDLGSRIRIPGPDASPEAKAEFFRKLEGVNGVVKLPDPKDKASIDAFFKKLGRPEHPDHYQIKLPEGMGVDETFTRNFRSLAYQLGLNQVQVDKLVELESARGMEILNELQIENTKTTEMLKKEWGNDFDPRLDAAKMMIKTYEGKFPDAVKELGDSFIGSNPVVIHMASELAKLYSEKGMIKGQATVSFGLTPEEARARIQEIRSNKGHPYNVDGHPQHSRAIEEMNQLYEALLPNKGESE